MSLYTICTPVHAWVCEAASHWGISQMSRFKIRTYIIGEMDSPLLYSHCLECIPQHLLRWRAVVYVGCICPQDRTTRGRNIICLHEFKSSARRWEFLNVHFSQTLQSWSHWSAHPQLKPSQCNDLQIHNPELEDHWKRKLRRSRCPGISSSPQRRRYLTDCPQEGHFIQEYTDVEDARTVNSF